MQTRSFHVTYRDRNGAIQTARTSGTGSTPARRRDPQHQGALPRLAGLQCRGRAPREARMSGYCESCDRFTWLLYFKGKRWLCSTCLGREL